MGNLKSDFLSWVSVYSKKPYIQANVVVTQWAYPGSRKQFGKKETPLICTHNIFCDVASTVTLLHADERGVAAVWCVS